MQRVPIPRLLALLAGSRTGCVIWRSFIIQAGLLFWFALYLTVFMVAGQASFGACGLVAVVLMLIWIRFSPKDACGEQQ